MDNEINSAATTMTNEEIVVALQADIDNNDLKTALWLNVYRLLYMLCDSWYHSYPVTFEHLGYTSDDLKQESYSAMMEAVRYFDIEKGYKFTTYLGYTLRHTMQRIMRQFKYDAMCHRMPLYETLPDVQAADDLDRIEQSDIWDKIRELVMLLPEKQREIIQKIYYQDMNYTETAKTLGVTRQFVSSQHQSVLRKLRHKLIKGGYVWNGG